MGPGPNTNWHNKGSISNPSKQFPVKIGNTTTTYTINIDANLDKNAKVTASKLTLQDTVTGKGGVGTTTQRPLATSTDGGKTWTPTKGSDGKPILSAEQIKALQPGGALYNAARTASQQTAKANGANDSQINQLNNGNVSAGIASTSTGSATPEQLEKQVEGLDDNRSPDKYGNLRYPLTITAEGKTQDYIQFTMIEYQPKKLNTDIASQLKSGLSKKSLFSDNSKSTKVGNQVIGGTVTLPIQPSITDTNSVSWNDQTINPFTAAVSGFATGLIDGESQKPSGNGTQTQTAANNKEGMDSLGTFIRDIFAGNAAGGEGQQLFTRTTGGILNPNLELLFNGPTLRSFSFTFSMSAREPNESIQIKKIIRFFKQGMSVKRATSALFLKTPHVFKIKYIFGKNGKDHPWLNTFKECALTSCSVNYTPSGSYATFIDGAMTQYDLSLTFTELEPIYDDDYAQLVPGGNTDTHIGF